MEPKSYRSLYWTTDWDSFQWEKAKNPKGYSKDSSPKSALTNPTWTEATKKSVIKMETGSGHTTQADRRGGRQTGRQRQWLDSRGDSLVDSERLMTGNRWVSQVIRWRQETVRCQLVDKCRMRGFHTALKRNNKIQGGRGILVFNRPFPLCYHCRQISVFSLKLLWHLLLVTAFYSCCSTCRGVVGRHNHEKGGMADCIIDFIVLYKGNE